MKGVIYVPSIPHTEWLDEILPGFSPAELPVAGRRIIDYNIEFVQKSGYEMCEVLDWRFSRRMEASFADLTATALPIFYQRGNGRQPWGLIDLMRMATPLTTHIEDDIAVAWGVGLPDGLADAPEFEPLNPGECADTPPGAYKRIDGRWMRFKHRIMTIASPRDWLDVNLKVLNSPKCFTLPGYSAEKDVYLGRNVVLEHGVDVKPPVLLHDDSWCARNVTLEGNVIVGRGSFVSEGAYLKNTVVGDDTCIGRGLELENKIVIGRRIIDADTGVYTDIEEPGIVRGIGGGGFLKKALAFIHGNSRGRAV